MTILLHIKKVPFYIYETANTARRAENLFGYQAYRAEFEQNKGVRAEILSKISDFYEHCRQAK